MRYVHTPACATQTQTETYKQLFLMLQKIVNRHALYMYIYIYMPILLCNKMFQVYFFEGAVRRKIFYINFI